MTKKKETKTNEKKKTTRKSGTRKAPAKSASASKGKNTSPPSEINQGPIALLILLLLVVGTGVAAHLFFKPFQRDISLAGNKEISSPVPRIHKEPRVIKPEKAVAVLEKTVKIPEIPTQDEIKIPTYEVFPKKELERERLRPVKEKHPDKPVLAIIIDDMGYDPGIAEAFMALDIPLTFSVLPHSPHGVRIANRAHERGYEVMLHLPMQPVEYPRIHPGPGALLLSMDPDEVIAALRHNLSAIPHIRGVNNHMGSALTASEPHINQIFTVLKKENFFFIDSRTAADSRGRSAARMFQLPFAERDVFLDHIQHKDAVKLELDRLLRIADKHGNALGIGHPHRVTLEGLQRILPEAKDRYRFVYASEFVAFVE
ncbi:divergent polysaccharide deacetylase family protein [Desulfobotulus mexicanus]|uniref:Divergent polysaccharide deacetylase family protein n=1 Tax=Desulfobotulus mexicanus TaxID=2586642 RepID=A0A5S5MEP5_9BACT|nr:divergent polysaccharide deacetylase family protein [Desulfobotulus mexicanus]TYT74149.1 divergent polysaccharide deacetylase family protein [Desulfobotulus mexicanus]